jgi:hypothetical protein
MTNIPARLAADAAASKRAWQFPIKSQLLNDQLNILKLDIHWLLDIEIW